MADVIDQQNNPTTNVATPVRYATTTNVLIGQSFVPTQNNVSKVELQLIKAGSPSGNVWAEIYTDSGGSPSSQTGADSSTVSCASITDTTTPGETVAFTFTPTITVTPATKYWIVINGDYAFSTSVNISWCRLNSSDSYAGNAIKSYNATIWESYDDPNDQWFNEYYSDVGMGGGLAGKRSLLGVGI